MACANEWGVLLSKLVDGEVTPEEKSHAETHVAECPDCARTLELFRRNEKVLESSLAGEAFGDLVVDDVMAEVRRLETPTVVAPTVEGSMFWAKVRRLWPMAAAAAAVLISAAIVYATRNPDRGPEIADLQRSIQRLMNERDVFSNRVQELDRELKDREVLEAVGPGQTWAEVSPEATAIEVQGTFEFQDIKRFDTFEVQRSQDDGKTWIALTDTLKEPRFEDRSFVSGVTYMYRFVGHGKDLRVETAPLHLRGTLLLPGGLNPLSSLQIEFIGGTTDLTRATVRVQRCVEGRPRSELFTVGLGQKIGEMIGGIDYSTNLILSEIVKGDQAIAFGDRVTTRLNKLVKLKAADALPGEPTLDIWCDTSRLIPLPTK